jgi:Domain of unknown function (DUF4124)
MRLLVALLLALPLLASAQAQWKWRDADGRIQFSDRPPPATVPDKDILQRPFAQRPRVQIVSADAPASETAPRSAAPAASTAVERAAALDKAKAEAAKKAEEKAKDNEQKQRRVESCRAARQNLAQLQSGVRIAQMNEKGEREVMEDAQRASQVRRAQELIASDCR